MSDDRPGLDDPLWSWILQERLTPYIEHARKWWANVEDLTVTDTGVFEIPDSPPGFMFRFTRTVLRSPIRGIQAFPLVPAAYLQITNIQGGATKMIDRVCLDDKFTMDEFTIVCKSNLPSTFQQGQFLAFVPTELLEHTKQLGIWLYLRPDELEALGNRVVLQTVVNKAILKL